MEGSPVSELSCAGYLVCFQGDADLSLHERRTYAVHQSITVAEGSMFAIHNSSIYEYDHAVSAPQDALQDNRVTLIVRFVDRYALDRLVSSVPVSSSSSYLIGHQGYEGRW